MWPPFKFNSGASGNTSTHLIDSRQLSRSGGGDGRGGGVVDHRLVWGVGGGGGWCGALLSLIEESVISIYLGGFYESK